MAYTHIQCIGYQVPTVAKVYNTTTPQNHNLPMPDIKDSSGINILPNSPQISNSSNTGNIPIYNDTVNPHTLSQPPAFVVNNNTNPDYKKWLPYGKQYLGKLIAYLEETSNVVNNDVDTLITYLKYYTAWGNWTIPSTTSSGGNVGILQVSNILNFMVDAYTLKGSSSDSLLGDTKYIDDLGTDSDAKNRVIRFLNVLYKASQNKKINSNKTTLKVFTAPEFYFRPEATVPGSTVYRAYTYEVYKAIKEVLRQTIQGMGLNHWLIVPGTIMWYMPANTTAHNKTVTANTYFNSCIYMHNTPGYFWGSYQILHKLEKARASHIDGVPYNDWDYGANAPKMLKKYYQDVKLKKHLFTINGIKTGLEICLEHIAGKSYNSKWYGVLQYIVKEKKTDTSRHLQLLVAGGMTTNLNSIMLRNKGVFFRNDGLSYETVTVAPGPPPVNEYRYVDARHNTALPTNLTPLKLESWFSLNNNNAYELQPPTLQGNKILLPGTMPFNAQNVFIYPTQKI